MRPKNTSGGPRRFQKTPGRPRTPQEAPGVPRKPQKAPGPQLRVRALHPCSRSVRRVRVRGKSPP